MKISALLDTNASLERVIDEARTRGTQGFDAVWATNIFSYDALSLLALIGREVPRIGLGTAVVPVYGRHPQVLAQSALTTSAAVGERLTLGIGVSHRITVESMWGLDFDRPVAYLRDYLGALTPLLRGEQTNYHGERITAHTRVSFGAPDVITPPVILAALGTAMLRLAGESASGTVTWMTGIKTVGSHIVPKITKAAREAGHMNPSVVVCLPICVTSDEQRGRELVESAYSFYGSLPSYRSMLDREGVAKPSDVALIGSKDEVRALLARVEEAGASEFAAAIVGDPAERDATVALLSEVAAR